MKMCRVFGELGRVYGEYPDSSSKQVTKLSFVGFEISEQLRVDEAEETVRKTVDRISGSIFVAFMLIMTEIANIILLSL